MNGIGSLSKFLAKVRINLGSSLCSVFRVPQFFRQMGAVTKKKRIFTLLYVSLNTKNKGFKLE